MNTYNVSVWRVAAFVSTLAVAMSAINTSLFYQGRLFAAEIPRQERQGEFRPQARAEMREQVVALIDESMRRKELGDLPRAYQAALRARQVDGMLAELFGEDVNAARIVIDLQLNLMLHHEQDFLNLVRSTQLSTAQRQELVSLLNVFTVLTRRELSPLDERTKTAIEQIEADRDQLNRVINLDAQDDDAKTELLELFQKEADIYRAASRPDLSLNALLRGHSREREFGMAGSARSVLGYTIGVFFQELQTDGDDIITVLASPEISSDIKTQIIQNLHEAVERHDFRTNPRDGER
jgi:hypothetical protein